MYEDEEAEIAPAVIDEDAETVTIPESEITKEQSHYDVPPDIPEILDSLEEQDCQAVLETEEEYPSVQGQIPAKFTGGVNSFNESFDQGIFFD